MLKIKIMAGKHNETALSWDKILIGIGILIILWKLAEADKQKTINNIMSDPEAKEKLEIETRKDAEEWYDEAASEFRY